MVTAGLGFTINRPARRLSLFTLTGLGFAIMTISIALIPFMPAYVWILPAGAVFGCGQGLLIPCLPGLIIQLAPEQFRAAFTGVYGTLIYAGQAVGPILFGMMYADMDTAWVFLTGGVMAAGLCVPFFDQRNPER